MHRVLAACFVSFAAASCGGETVEPRILLRVDQTLSATAKVASPHNALDATHYVAHAPEDRYVVEIAAHRVTIRPLERTSTPISGTRQSGPAGQTRFELDEGLFAGGRFVIDGDRAELTVYGAGVPVVTSERGTLVQR
jgi:hypothetical protein